MQLPIIAALLAAGIVFGVIFPGRLTDAFGAATLYMFLPALIFEGAWRLELRTMKNGAGPITMLALPGVFATAAIVALGVHFAGFLAWDAALLLGVILSATDPVAVIAIFRRLNLPRTLTTIVESEALLNDAAAVVLYRAVLAAVLAGAGTYVWQVAGTAALGIVLGVLLGCALAFVSAWILGKTSQLAAYIAITLAGAYGGYYLANTLNWSGILTVVAFGILLRHFHYQDMGEICAQAVERFWERFALIANAALFFLVGAAIDLRALGRFLPIALLTLAIVFVARFVIVYGLLGVVRPKLHITWMTIVRLAGIRGALSLALALAIPANFPGREAVVDSTFLVVVVTVFGSLLTLNRRIEGVKPAP